MGKDQKGFIVYGDIKPVVDRLSDEEAGQLLRGMLNYFVDGKPPKFDGVLEFVFIPIKQQMDRNAVKYESKCEKMRANANKRWQKTSESNGMQLHANDANTNTNTDTDTNTKTNTDTNTTTNTKRGGSGGIDSVYGVEDEFNIWKMLTSEDVDQIYDVYPDTGGDLIQEVYEDVRAKKKTVKNPVAYVLGYAKKVGWDDTAGGAS